MSTESLAEVTAEERRIYEFVFRDGAGPQEPDRPPWLVDRVTTMRTSDLHGQRDWLLRHRCPADLLDAMEALDPAKRVIPALDGCPLAQMTDFPEQGYGPEIPLWLNQWWEGSRREPPYLGFVHFSRIAFSSDGERCLVGQSFLQDPHCGSGAALWLKREGESWSIEGTGLLWIA